LTIEQAQIRWGDDGPRPPKSRGPQFDPFFKEHLETHGNKGKGKPSYLSSTICDKLIDLMGETSSSYRTGQFQVLFIDG
jgi:hypothetical protein